MKLKITFIFIAGTLTGPSPLCQRLGEEDKPCPVGNPGPRTAASSNFPMEERPLSCVLGCGGFQPGRVAWYLPFGDAPCLLAFAVGGERGSFGPALW